MHTILGAGGAVARELLKALGRRPVRLVSRHPTPVVDAEVVAADVSDLDQTIAAVAGSSVVYLVVGLKYDVRVWRDLWPRIMDNTIEACKRAGARLVFLDNVYMYGRVDGPMTEATPFNPCSTKGEVRARIATSLLNAIKAGHLTALIARSADFYGPGVRTSIPNTLVFDKFAKGGKASWLVNDSVTHAFTYTPDAAQSLVLLASHDPAWNQTWHVPTAPDPPTGRAFIEMAAQAFGVPARYRVLTKPMLKIAGWFDRTVGELGEMLYQYDRAYLFDSTKFRTAFAFEPTSYRQGILTCAATS